MVSQAVVCRWNTYCERIIKSVIAWSVATPEMEPRGDEGDDAMLEAAMAELSAHEQHDSNNSSPDAPKAQHDLDWDEVQRRHDAAIAEARAALGRGPRSANEDTNNRATGSNAVCNKSSAPAATPPKAHATKLSAGVGPKSGSASKSTKPSSADRVLSGGKSHAGDSSQSTKAVEVALEHEAAPTTAARSLDLHEAAPLEPRVSSGTAVECGKNGNSNDSGIDHHSDQEEGADEDDEDDDVAAADRFDEERYGPPARRGPTFDGVPLSRSAVGNADDSHGEGGGHEDVVEGDASSPVGPRYDETLPDGGYVRRRRRSVMEGDELPPEKKDEGMAQACKEEGNRHFGAGDYDTAAACYTEAMRYAPSDVSYDAQRAVLYANRAACHLQQSKHGEALYDCDR